MENLGSGQAPLMKVTWLTGASVSSPVTQKLGREGCVEIVCLVRPLTLPSLEPTPHPPTSPPRIIHGVCSCPLFPSQLKLEGLLKKTPTNPYETSFIPHKEA